MEITKVKAIKKMQKSETWIDNCISFSSVLPSLYSPVAVSDVTKMICFRWVLYIISAEIKGPSATEDSRWKEEGKPLGIQSKELCKYNWELVLHVLGRNEEELGID
jgi:hypothetical protein